jgi:hypothetical protein
MPKSCVNCLLWTRRNKFDGKQSLLDIITLLIEFHILYRFISENLPREWFYSNDKVFTTEGCLLMSEWHLISETSLDENVIVHILDIWFNIHIRSIVIVWGHLERLDFIYLLSRQTEISMTVGSRWIYTPVLRNEQYQIQKLKHLIKECMFYAGVTLYFSCIKHCLKSELQYKFSTLLLPWTSI